MKLSYSLASGGDMSDEIDGNWDIAGELMDDESWSGCQVAGQRTACGN